MRNRVLGGIVILLVGALPMAAVSQSAAFTVAKLVVCEDVQNRTPVNVKEVFPAGTETVFCFLEARDIPQTTEVKMVWFHEEQEVARVPLTLGQGARWRTFTSKRTMGLQGNWKVYLVDNADNTLASVAFVLE
jgi:DNA polymerase III delta prime subunit